MFLEFRVWVGFIHPFFVLSFFFFPEDYCVFWKAKTKDKSDTNEDDDDTHKRRRRVSKAKRERERERSNNTCHNKGGIFFDEKKFDDDD